MNDNHESHHDESDEAMDRAVRAATAQPSPSDIRDRVIEMAAAWQQNAHVAVDDHRRAARDVLVEDKKEVPSDSGALAHAAGLVEQTVIGQPPRQPQIRTGMSHTPLLEQARTLILSHKRLSLAAATMATALAASLILHVFPSFFTTAYALEQTAQANERVTSYHLQVSPPAAVAGVGEAWLQMAPDGGPLDARVDMFGGDYGDRVGIVSRSRAEFWWKAHNVRVVSDNETWIDLALRQCARMRNLFDPKLAFYRLREDEAAGKVQVATKDLEKPDEPITLTVTSRGEPNRRHVYEVNPQSKLVERVIEYQGCGDEWKQVWECRYLDYNKEIDRSVFQPEYPKDIVTVDPSKVDFGRLGLAQGNLADDQIAAALAKDLFEALLGGEYQKFAQLNDVRTATWKITSVTRGPRGETETSTGTGMYLAPSHERTEMTLRGRKEIEICDGQKDNVLTLVPSANAALVVRYKNQPYSGFFGRTFPDWRKVVTDALVGTYNNVERLGVETIDGRPAEGFRTRRGASERTIWADPKTSLPIRVERVAWVSPDEVRTVMTDFRANVDLDESLFNLDVPAGYAVESKQVDLSKTSVDRLADALKLAAEQEGDVFPPTLLGEEGLPIILHRAAAALEAKYGKDSPEMLKLGSEIAMNRQAALVLLSDLSPANDWHYAGKGVKLYTPDMPIFWFKPTGADKYRVVFADLKIKDLALEAFEFPFGPPSKPLGDDQFEVAFSYRPGRTVESVYLVGSFNDWKPTAHKMDGPDHEGRFSARLKLKKGTYEYKFVLDGQTWETDPNNIWQRGLHGNSEVHVGLPFVADAKPLGDDQFEVAFSYRPVKTVEAVYLAGSFNDWKPTAHKMDGPDHEGRYSARLKLKKGTYEYKFVLDGQTWETDPENVWRTGPYQNSLFSIGVR